MYGNFSREMSTYSFSTVQMYVRCMSRSFLTGRCPNTRFLRCYGALANQYTIYNSTSLLPHLLCQLFCVTLTQPSFDRLSSWFYAHRGFIHTYSRPRRHFLIMVLSTHTADHTNTLSINSVSLTCHQQQTAHGHLSPSRTV